MPSAKMQMKNRKLSQVKYQVHVDHATTVFKITLYALKPRKSTKKINILKKVFIFQTECFTKLANKSWFIPDLQSIKITLMQQFFQSKFLQRTSRYRIMISIHIKFLVISITEQVIAHRLRCRVVIELVYFTEFVTDVDVQCSAEG